MTTIALNQETTLTDYEQIGFGVDANLADGHAYQALSAGQSAVVARLAETWRTSEQETIPASEDRYIRSFASIAGEPGVLAAAGKFVLPTASNSIDLVGAYLKLRDSRVLLTHPTFDNLALLLRRRGVEPAPISEPELVDSNALADRLSTADVLFIVNPNNPSGRSFSESEFRSIVDGCVRNDVTVVVDASFRLFYAHQWDSYGVLQQAGASYIVFEDTGKVFPTQDMKASILACSADHAGALRELYNEVYLCVSKFTLAVLGDFFEDAGSAGLKETVHDLVQHRRNLIRSAVPSWVLDPIAADSRISVEWLTIESLGRPDQIVVGELRQAGVAVLPGRGFFWNAHHRSESQRNVRVSLMKSEQEFLRGVEILGNFFAQESVQ